MLVALGACRFVILRASNSGTSPVKPTGFRQLCFSTIVTIPPFICPQRLQNNSSNTHKSKSNELRLKKALDYDNIQAYASLLREFSNAKDLVEGKRVHDSIIRHGYGGNIYLCNLVVDLYGKCDALQDARSVFDRMQKRNLFTWNIMIAAFAQHGCATETLQLFQQLHQEGLGPDKFTFSSVLGACATMGTTIEGTIVHAMLSDGRLESNAIVGTALINMYSKHGRLKEAERVFDVIHPHDTLSWSAMIAAYAQQGDGDMALQLFEQMQREGIKSDSVAFLGVLAGCASLAILSWGKLFHASTITSGFEADALVGNALISMYGKCGNLQHAQWVFDQMLQRDVVSWTAIISAYAQLGHVEEALQHFLAMQLDGVMPNDITFVSILSACSHGGMMDKGLFCFLLMKNYYNITPTLEHYGCLIDLYGRAGQLQEAEDVIIKMHLKPNSVIWETLFGACKVHSDIDRGRRAAEYIMQLDPLGASLYVTLADFCVTEYATRTRWSKV